MSGEWIVRNGRILRPSPCMLAGIVNVTPDSFSDGGLWIDPDQAAEHGCKLLNDGADMLDFGAESTRPGSDPVTEQEEKKRLIPALRAMRLRCPDAVLSADTWRAGTAAAALEEGVSVINDVYGCSDPEMADVLAQYRPGYVLMHSGGVAKTMQDNPQYDDVVAEELRFFEKMLKYLVGAGLPEDRIVLDPGFGFGKNAEHTRALFLGLEKLMELGRPLYVGISRKSFFQFMFGLKMPDRDQATAVCSALMAARGVPFHRVHDVSACRTALDLAKVLTPGM
ncbi:MAG: dihydropteroate synthase [Desulfovibrionaceae bacterium]|nr:dihydropteroate synthase [Desulfovibrionaceae bacterium]